jgi:hypothetical protein
MHSLYKNDIKTRVFSCSMGIFEVRGPQFGELDAATMDCVVGKVRPLVHRHGSSHCTTGRSVVVLVALCWVLQSLYRVTPSELLDLIDDLLRSRHLQLEHRPVLQAAVQALGCSHTVSFDKGAVRWAGVALLDLDAP